jgi:hypothetical protein
MMLKTIPQWLRALRLTRLKAGGDAEIVRTRAQSWRMARKPAAVEHQDTESFAALAHALAIDNSRAPLAREGAISALFQCCYRTENSLTIFSSVLAWPAEPH